MKESVLPVAEIPTAEDPLEREGRWAAMHVIAAVAAGGVLTRAAYQMRLRWPWLNMAAAVLTGLAGSLAGLILARAIDALWPRFADTQAPPRARFWTRYVSSFATDTYLFAWLSGRLEGRSLPHGSSNWSWIIGWPLVALMLAVNAIDVQVAERITASRRSLLSDRTGLRNYRALDADLATCADSGMDFTLVYLDLDGFKQVNDRLGHETGDRVLADVGVVLDQLEGFAYHISGDEFTLLQAGGDQAHTTEQARAAHDQIRAIGDRYGVPLGASFGVRRVASGRSAEVAEVRRLADEAMLSAKRAGKGRLAFETGESIDLRAQG